MFHVWSKSMSGNFSVTVLLDLDSVVTRRYDRSEMAAAMAAYTRPWDQNNASPARGGWTDLAVDDGVLAKHNHLARRRDHERGCHGARLLAVHPSLGGEFCFGAVGAALAAADVVISVGALAVDVDMFKVLVEGVGVDPVPVKCPVRHDRLCAARGLQLQRLGGANQSRTAQTRTRHKERRERSECAVLRLCFG
jgi:hypothetical protein